MILARPIHSSGNTGIHGRTKLSQIIQMEQKSVKGGSDKLEEGRTNVYWRVVNLRSRWKLKKKRSSIRRS